MGTKEQLLHLYLRDHLAGATGGLALAERIATMHRNSWAGADLERFAAEVAEDRDTLLELMAAVGANPGPVKAALAAIGERLARLKANGILLRRSPLSTVIELEMMRMGVEGKTSGWRTLREIASGDARIDRDRMDSLVSRAEAQAAKLEELRVRAVAEVLAA